MMKKGILQTLDDLKGEVLLYARQPRGELISKVWGVVNIQNPFKNFTMQMSNV